MSDAVDGGVGVGGDGGHSFCLLLWMVIQKKKKKFKKLMWFKLV